MQRKLKMNRKLKAKIIEKFGSQAEFSMKVPEDESIISRVVQERRKLNPERQDVWAIILGCKTKDLFDGKRN
jgi:hypothetical protein